MRLLLLAGYDHPENQGGVSTFNRNLIKIFEQELSIITYFTTKKKIYRNNYKNLVEIYKINNFLKRIDNKFLNLGIQKFLLKKEIKKRNPEVYFINNPKDVKFLKKEKKRKILIQHTSYDAFIRIYFNNNKEKITRFFNEEIDTFICLSKYDKERFITELKIKNRNFKVIRHISEIEIKKEKKEKNKELIIIARIDNHSKRFDLLIKAMKKLSDFTLKIYGDGDIKLLEKIIKENNLDNIFLCGSTNNVKEKLDEAGIFVMTSDYEGYPISTIEAMRRGLPIVLRNTFDSAKDIVKGNGILLDKEWNEDKFVEAVRKIYNNYEYYSENSKKLGERYNFCEIEKEWKAIIK